MKEIEQDVYFSFKLDKNNSIIEQTIGRLLVSKSEGMSLIFYDKDPNKYNHLLKSDDFFLLYIFAPDGEKFTALDCFIRRTSAMNWSSKDNMTKTEITINRIFEGGWFDDIKNMNIDNIHVRFSYLEHWCGNLDIDYKRNKSNKKLKEVIIPIEQLSEDFKVTIDDKFSIELISSWSSDIENNKKFIFDTSKYFKFKFKKAIHLHDLEKQVYILHRLFQVLLVNEKVFNEEMYFYKDGHKITIYSQKIRYTPEKESVRSLDFFAVYSPSHVEKTKELIKLWYDKYQAYGRVFDTLTLVLDQKAFAYTENRFLVYAQWIEGFCRVKYPTLKEEKDVHKIKIESIRKHLKGPDLDYFNKLVSFPFETSFGDQLNNIIKDTETQKIVDGKGEDLKTLSMKIKQQRNKLTHIDKKKITSDGFSFVHQTNFMENLIYLILITELKLTGNIRINKRIYKEMKFSYDKYFEEL